MFIEIRKAGFVNKGAELMLYSVLDKMKEAYPQAEFVMSASITPAPYYKRARLGLYQKPQYWRYGLQFGYLTRFLPKIIRDIFGIIVDKELNVVLDAAGFSYSDQWGGNNLQELVNYSNYWKRNGTKLILLPQAFGPFEKTANRHAIKKVVENSELIFARDKISYQYLTEVVGLQEKIRIAPDFTNLIPGRISKKIDANRYRFCLIPNYRMIDKTSRKESGAYLPFMIESAKYLISKGVSIFILVHEGDNDLVLAKEINNAVGRGVPIVCEGDPLKIKGILGRCDGTIGSRFHGLVSALSQGVPSLSTGWSHKYQMLFEDYDFAEGVIDIMCSNQELHKKIDLIIDEVSHEKIKSKITLRGDILKDETKIMWQEVINVINKT